MKKVLLYIHGKGGSYSEAEQYKIKFSWSIMKRDIDTMENGEFIN